MSFNAATIAQKPHTNDAVEQTNGDGWRDRPERVPPQEEGILENANHQCKYNRN